MKITTVKYRTNRPSKDNKFVHEHVELEAQLAKGETPELVVNMLRVQAQELLYPELKSIDDRIGAISPKVAEYARELPTATLGALYRDNIDMFDSFFLGDVAPATFLRFLKQQVDQTGFEG